MNKTNENSKPSNNATNVTLENVRMDRDRKLLSDWLHSEKVRKWWGDPKSRTTQIEKTLHEMHALICTSHSPVGYICWQNVVREELDSVGLFEVPDSLVDIDIFIGDPNARGQGIGPKALELLLLRLRDTTKTRLVGLVTSINNQSAISAFQKAGFIKTFKFNSPSFGMCWLMENQISD